jgi:2-methylaconitate cis-trans-isomerase PrpF
MPRRRLPCTFMRGGTSKALVFLRRDLPEDSASWDAIFLAAMGSPDAYGRQLDGMGGGISSLSKVCVVGPATRPDADVDYTFAQVQVGEARVAYDINCGNMSSAIGPFAIASGLVAPGPDGISTVRIHNTNTRKLIHAVFEVRDGVAREDGDLTIPGVSGQGAPIRLDFVDPGGAATGRLLPAGSPRTTLAASGGTTVDASLVDAANACVFVEARSLGLRGTELPDELEADHDFMRRLKDVRARGAVAMGLAGTPEEAERNAAAPFVALVAPPQAAATLDGGGIDRDAMDLTVRVLSNGRIHRALPLTISLCTAVAAQIEGSVVHAVARAGGKTALRLGMPSGVLQVGADVEREGTHWRALSGSFYRTARRLFERYVYY